MNVLLLIISLIGFSLISFRFHGEGGSGGHEDMVTAESGDEGVLPRAEGLFPQWPGVVRVLTFKE